jgi:peroxiredoxin
MRTSICSVLSAFCLTAVCPAAPAEPPPPASAVVRLAPDFSIPGPGPKPRTLRSLRGQSVVLLIAKSAKTGALKKQVRYLQELFEQFASKGTIFAVALRQGDAQVQSNIPIATVNNGAAVADAYGVKKDFGIAIIGRDGNLDYITDKVVPPERIRDVVQNSFPVQAAIRDKK